MHDAAEEINFDGLVGPTHNYAGLARGNLASQRHRHLASHPCEAARQGLAKMQTLLDFGMVQGVLPPQQRPDLAFLRRVGFDGDDARVVRRAAADAPHLLAAAYSASSMWTANAATVGPAADAEDGRVHFTPANLVGNLHRALEARPTAALLARLFPEGDCFAHHDPLPPVGTMGDEGAANHMRLCATHGSAGVQCFVYGVDPDQADGPRPTRHPARQTLAASRAVARLHRLDPARTLFLQQSPTAIDAGVFHNDVVAVAHQSVLLFHEQAFVEGPAAVERIDAALREQAGIGLQPIAVPAAEVPLADAVSSYLFNSQLLSLPGGRTLLLCPSECREGPAVSAWLDRLIDGAAPIDAVHAIDVRQSMRNGGGPACLRLRVVLNAHQRSAMHGGVLLEATRLQRLETCVDRHYRDTLTPDDLADPSLIRETHDALDALTAVLDLPGLYPFQQ